MRGTPSPGSSSKKKGLQGGQGQLPPAFPSNRCFVTFKHPLGWQKLLLDFGRRGMNLLKVQQSSPFPPSRTGDHSAHVHCAYTGDKRASYQQRPRDVDTPPNHHRDPSRNETRSRKDGLITLSSQTPDKDPQTPHHEGVNGRGSWGRARKGMADSEEERKNTEHYLRNKR